MNLARVSPPDDSLIYGCEASQHQEWMGPMSSDFRVSFRDREHGLPVLMEKKTTLTLGFVRK